MRGSHIARITIDALKSYHGKNEIMVLGIGTAEGGPVKTGDDSFLTDATGRRVFSKLDVDNLQRLKSSAGIQVATVTLDDADVHWIQRRMRTHLEQKEADELSRWKDAGWWLVIPIALLGALWFRRGWTIRWASLIWLGMLLAAPDRPAAADWRFLDLWLTPDQQGRLAYERGEYDAAAARFEDPMWQGVALYRAGRYEDAIDAFARVDSAESYFNQGNALARLGKLKAAAASYREALARRPDWPEATANLALVEKLIPPEKKDEEEAADASQKADQVTFDDKGKQGKAGQVELGTQTAEVWMRNIQTTPADLLARRFAIQAQQGEPKQ
jgi:Ca-activated chloride channel family protein